MSVLDLLTGLAQANLAAGAAIVVVALLRKPARRAFGAQAAYLLWIAPVLAGAAALVPPASAPAPLMAPVMLDVVVAASGAVAATVDTAPRLPALLLGLWIVGGLAAAGLLLRRQARFVAALGRLERLSPRLFRAEQGGTGPAVVGAFRPRIVTPADFEDRFAPEEREVILAHEGAHLAAGDARTNALAALALCACWFNPLVHVAVYLMRLDQELACDAAVLSRFPKARRLYAEVLLKTQLATQPLPFGCHWPAAAEHPLKERITMLKSPLPAPGRRVAGIAVVALLSAIGAAAAWAAQPGQPKLAPVLAAAAASPLPSLDRPCTADEKRLYNCKDGPGPVWLAKPTAEQIRAEYPADALKAGVSGRAFLSCLVNGADGTLRECIAVREIEPGIRKPQEYDFERPAMRLAKYYRVDVASLLPRDARGRLPMMRIAVDFVSTLSTTTSAADAAAITQPVHNLTQAEARAQAGPNDDVLCKPGTDWTQKNCRIVHGKTWAQVATAADIAEAYPAMARQAGLTARVMLQCAPNLATRTLDGCEAVRVMPIDGPAPPAAMNGAFEQAAIRVAAKYRLASPLPADLGLGKRFFMTVDFSGHPVLAGGPPAAPVTGPGPHGPVLPVMPDWLLRPDGADWVRFYPAAAKAAGQEGRATIACRVDGEGRLGMCQLINEAPLGAGFGEAALALAAKFQMKPLDREGRPTSGADVRIPIRFTLPAAETAPAPAKVSDARRRDAGLQLARLMGAQVSGRPDIWPPR